MMKVLVVIDGDNSEPIAYSSKVDADVETEVRAAVNQLAIITSDGYVSQDDMVADIAYELKHGRAMWLNEKWCFDVIVVDWH